jgi:hypothetical protein
MALPYFFQFGAWPNHPRDVIFLIFIERSGILASPADSFYSLSGLVDHN